MELLNESASLLVIFFVFTRDVSGTPLQPKLPKTIFCSCDKNIRLVTLHEVFNRLQEMISPFFWDVTKSENGEPEFGNEFTAVIRMRSQNGGKRKRKRTGSTF